MNPRYWGACGPLLQHLSTPEGDTLEATSVRTLEPFTEDMGQFPVNNSRSVLLPLAKVLIEGDRDVDRVNFQRLRDFDHLSEEGAHAVATLVWGGAR